MQVECCTDEIWIQRVDPRIWIYALLRKKYNSGATIFAWLNFFLGGPFITPVGIPDYQSHLD